MLATYLFNGEISANELKSWKVKKVVKLYKFVEEAMNAWYKIKDELKENSDVYLRKVNKNIFYIAKIQGEMIMFSCVSKMHVKALPCVKMEKLAIYRALETEDELGKELRNFLELLIQNTSSK